MIFKHPIVDTIITLEGFGLLRQLRFFSLANAADAVSSDPPASKLCCINFLLCMSSFLLLKFTDKHLIKTETLPRSLICFFLVLLTAISTSAQQRKHHFSSSKMGSPFNIIIVSADSVQAAVLAERSFSLVDSFNHIYSDYDTSSELSKLNGFAGNGKQKVSPALWELFLRAKTAWQKSMGAYDVTVGPLSLLWRKSRREKHFLP
jgi:hypothetical protein